MVHQVLGRRALNRTLLQRQGLLDRWNALDHPPPHGEGLPPAEAADPPVLDRGLLTGAHGAWMSITDAGPVVGADRRSLSLGGAVLVNGFVEATWKLVRVRAPRR